MNLKVKLNYKKSTKGTFVFGNSDDEAPIPTLYIKRGAFSGEIPKTIILTIEESNDE